MSVEAARLLIVDDEADNLRALCETLALKGYVTRGFDSPRAALAALQPGEYDLLLTDLMMPDMDGIELIAAASRADPGIGSVVMTGHGAIDTAVQAMQGGALDYIVKPFNLRSVLQVLSRALALQRLRRENALLQETERRQAGELAAAYADLEAFTYSVSHDLRAPLLFVKDFAQRLRQQYSTQLGDEGGRIVQVIVDGSRSLDEMIVGLLEFSRSARQPLEVLPLDMTALARAAADESRKQQPAARVVFEIGRLPQAWGDPVVMQHVWSNLVSNAVKFSASRERPMVRISGHTEGGEAHYTVEDNGVGFDAQYADKLFGVFKRLHDAAEFPGTGVGLAIVQRILTRHGGRIWADSAPDRGATFHFALPSTGGTTPAA